ncbi:hypothetical protein AB0L99_44055 [Streptomyces sp. NPDC051954]|uniref:hypothetical protein n=1 Tax=unclassified Streptomyces TaxID=2593676 RepID=UPI00342FDEC5
MPSDLVAGTKNGEVRTIDVGQGEYVVVNLATCGPAFLVDYFVMEIGIRQAWPFVTFANNQEGADLAEVRLYIDGAFTVESAGSPLDGAEHDDIQLWLLRLAKVLNLTVEEAVMREDTTLFLRFDGDLCLQISGSPATWTTADVWWFGTS